MNRWWKTIAFIIVAAILTRWIPYSNFFRNVDTLIHEFGHAVMTLLLSGKVIYIHLFADHSGVTYSTVHEAWRLIPISLAGYTASALFAYILFTLYRYNRIQAGLILITLITLINLAFFVRNEFGLLWCIGFIIMNMLLYIQPWSWLLQGYYLLIAFILVVESIISPITLVLITAQQPLDAGDASNLQQATGIPSILWALLFVIIAAGLARMSMGAFLGKKGRHLSYARRRRSSSSYR